MTEERRAVIDAKTHVQTIQSVVADYYGVTVQQLLKRSAWKGYPPPRHIAAWLCFKNVDLPNDKIAAYFNVTDGTMLKRTIERIDGELYINSNLATELAEITSRLGGLSLNVSVRVNVAYSLGHCPACGSKQSPVEVHNHIQCSDCGFRIETCCGD